MTIEVRNSGHRRIEVKPVTEGRHSESDFTRITPDNVEDYLDVVRRRIGAKVPPRFAGGRRVQAFS